jgi:hypothetical protein
MPKALGIKSYNSKITPKLEFAVIGTDVVITIRKLADSRVLPDYLGRFHELVDKSQR